jgi:hypothetical protein
MLRVLENRVLGEIFGPKWEEEAGGWRRLHNEEIRNLYDSKNIRVLKTRRIVLMGGACSTYGRDENLIKSLGQQTTRKA